MLAVAFAALVASAAAFAPALLGVHTGASSLNMALDKSSRAPVITVFHHRGCSARTPLCRLFERCTYGNARNAWPATHGTRGTRAATHLRQCTVRGEQTAAPVCPVCSPGTARKQCMCTFRVSRSLLRCLRQRT